MDGKHTAHDIKHGTLFKFHAGQRLENHCPAGATFGYVYRSRTGIKNHYADAVMAYCGLHRIEEIKMPSTSRRRTLRRRVYHLKPSFLLKGKLVLIDKFDLVYPYPDQGNIYNEDEVQKC